MALKQWHKMNNEMVTKDTKMGWNCDSDEDKLKKN